MSRFSFVLLTGLFILTVQPALSQTADDNLEPHEQALVLPLSAATTATGMARVITSGGRPGECLAPVSVTRIDGEHRVVSAQGFLIEPGVHTINGRAMLDMTNCPLTESNPVIASAADLEIDFEPEVTYHIGYYHPPANTEDWKLVVWHVDRPEVEPAGF